MPNEFQAPPPPKVLFILKLRDNYSEFQPSSYCYSNSYSSGLYNSAKFLVNMLHHAGIESKLVQVVDNNSIDQEVAEYQPTHAIIEALWVVPEKFDILQRLHPSVKWIVRGHSAIPFLANESIAIEWINKYVQFENVVFSPNCSDSARDIRTVVSQANPEWTEGQVREKVPLLPNFYPTSHARRQIEKPSSDTLDIACFGAIRPLKNQLIQALAAMEFAEDKGKKLRFHINGSRSEQGGQANLDNIRFLFQYSKHELVEHTWLEHAHFLEFLRTCDCSLTASLTETFCIVAADSVVSGVPLVCSDEVMWSSRLSQAAPTSTADIVQKMHLVTSKGLGAAARALNLSGLRSYSERSKRLWLGYLRPEDDFWPPITGIPVKMYFAGVRPA